MTRFARAKGSKASNERLPAEATPWHIMKQQLETSTSKESSEKPKNAKELLKEKDDPYYCDTLVSNNDWAEFETAKSTKSIKKNDFGKIEKKSPKKVSPEKVSTKVSNDKSSPDKSRKRKFEKFADDGAENVAKNKKKNKPVVNEANNESENVPKKKKKKNKLKSVENSTEVKEADENKKENVTIGEKNVSSVKLSKRQKRNRKNKMKNESNVDKQEEVSTPITFNVEGNDWNTDIKFGCGNGKSKANKHNPKPENNNYPNNYRDNRFNQKTVKQRPGKIRDDLEHKRRKPDPGAQKVIINGLEVEIVLYDGFPVRKDDAERLKELRKKLVLNGIPKPDINRAMKLERRKAEKALARIRKNVCFHCRKAGHNLSDCPELGREEAATGICFKCGSTEHTHFECKVNKKEEFRFATCFICREQGHIAKQCPDNPKGLYPQGGACKICGDVTHLKKDCPDLTSQKEETKITLSTIADVDSMEIDGVEKNEKSGVVEKTKKIIKF